MTAQERLADNALRHHWIAELGRVQGAADIAHPLRYELLVLFLVAIIISDLIAEFEGHGHVSRLSKCQSRLPKTAENGREAS